MKCLMFVKPNWGGAAFGISKVRVERNYMWPYGGSSNILYFRHLYYLAEVNIGSRFNIQRIRKYG